MKHKKPIFPAPYAYQQLYGVRIASDTVPDELTSISIRPRAKTDLLQRLNQRGKTQWGVVFGAQEGHTLHVHQFVMAAPRHHLSRPFKRFDTSYLQGVTDTITALSHENVDWSGLWIIPANSQKGSLSQELEWLENAFMRGQVGGPLPLICPAFDEGDLVISAYTYADDETPISLPVRF